MNALGDLLSGLDWSPLFISLKTGVVATFVSFFLGIFAARKVVRAGAKTKAIADGILTLLPRLLTIWQKRSGRSEPRFTTMWCPGS